MKLIINPRISHKAGFIALFLIIEDIKETTIITALIEDIMNVSLLIKEHPQHYLNITKMNIYKTEKLIKQT